MGGGTPQIALVGKWTTLKLSLHGYHHVTAWVVDGNCWQEKAFNYALGIVVLNFVLRLQWYIIFFFDDDTRSCQRVALLCSPDNRGGMPRRYLEITR